MKVIFFYLYIRDFYEGELYFVVITTNWVKFYLFISGMSNTFMKVNFDSVTPIYIN